MIEYLEFDNAQQNFLAGLGWEEKPDGRKGLFSSGHNLDLCCCLMTKEFNLIDFISPSDPKIGEYRFQIMHTGDHRTGSSPGEDEEIHINLSKLDPEICYLAFVVQAQGSTDFDAVEKPGCVFMDGGSYRVFLRMDIKAAPRDRKPAAGRSAQYVAAVLRRWAGRSLEGDSWTLQPAGWFVERSNQGYAGDFWHVKSAVEEIYSI